MTLKLPALDPATVESIEKSGYPAPFNQRVIGRSKRKLGDACGLTQFGVNVTTLQPGSQSALRHWHTQEDEFVYVLSGELVLITDIGEQVLQAGQCAGFPGGKRDGHHLVNRSSQPASYLEVGSRIKGDVADYPDEDMTIVVGVNGIKFVHKDGQPY
jgi:uncharacterized cupin superfamily protein